MSVSTSTIGYLLRGTPKYMFSIPSDKNKAFQFVCLPRSESNSSEIQDSWSNEEFAELLAYYWSNWGIRFEDIFTPPSNIKSTMQFENGDILLMNADGSISGRISNN